jgi:hypothetical protein
VSGDSRQVQVEVQAVVVEMVVVEVVKKYKKF